MDVRTLSIYTCSGDAGCPRGHLVFVVVLVGRMALLWPPENAMVPLSAAVEREPAQETAPVLLVSNE